MLDRDIIMQKALMGPLKFGDPEQIAALNMIEREILKKEEYAKMLREGVIKRYHVRISFSGETEVFVNARSIQEAEEIAEEEMGVEVKDGDIEVDSISVYEVNQEVKGEGRME